MEQRYKRIFKEHSKEFLKLLKEVSPDQAIRILTHKTPILVFQVTPDGKVLNAKNAHFENPPNGDKSILAHKTNKSHLRGKAAIIGDVLYIVIYGNNIHDLDYKQEALLRISYPKILYEISKNKSISKDILNTAIFIKENGERILV